MSNFMLNDLVNPSDWKLMRCAY